MVRLSRLFLTPRSGLGTPFRVKRFRYVAKGAEYLFKDYENITISENFDGTLQLKSNNIIRLALDGCTNRPCYRIVLANRLDGRDSEIEQLGYFDPMPNMFNEKVCTFNYERIKYHLAMGAHPARPIRRLLGLSGFLPLDPTLFLFARGLRRRREIERLIEEKEAKESDDNSGEEET